VQQRINYSTIHHRHELRQRNAGWSKVSCWTTLLNIPYRCPRLFLIGCLGWSRRCSLPYIFRVLATRRSCELCLSTINGAESPLITKAVAYSGLSKVRFESVGSPNNVRLVSRSLDFLYKFGASAPIGTKALLLVDQPWRVGRLPKRKHSNIQQWVRKDHSKFGGATDYCYLFGIVLGLELKPTLSN
jgi:hypothetical protein